MLNAVAGRQVQDEQVLQAQHEHGPGASPAPAASAGRVLIVEDDRGMLELYSDILLEHGFRIAAACDGHVAARLLGCGRLRRRPHGRLHAGGGRSGAAALGARAGRRSAGGARDGQPVPGDGGSGGRDGSAALPHEARVDGGAAPVRRGRRRAASIRRPAATRRRARGIAGRRGGPGRARGPVRSRHGRRCT